MSLQVKAHSPVLPVSLVSSTASSPTSTAASGTCKASAMSLVVTASVCSFHSDYTLGYARKNKKGSRSFVKVLGYSVAMRAKRYGVRVLLFHLMLTTFIVAPCWIVYTSEEIYFQSKRLYVCGVRFCDQHGAIVVVVTQLNKLKRCLQSHAFERLHRQQCSACGYICSWDNMVRHDY